jgi:MFS family permease
MFLGGVLFLSNVWGYDTAHAGLGMTPGPLIVIVVAPIAGRIAARTGHRVLLVLGGIVFGSGFLLRWAVTSATPHYLSQWLPVVLTTGIGVGLLMPSLASAGVHGLPQHRLGVGSAVNQAIRQIGFVLGVALTIAVGRQHTRCRCLVRFSADVPASCRWGIFDCGAFLAHRHAPGTRTGAAALAG